MQKCKITSSFSSFPSILYSIAILWQAQQALGKAQSLLKESYSNNAKISGNSAIPTKTSYDLKI